MQSDETSSVNKDQSNIPQSVSFNSDVPNVNPVIRGSESPDVNTPPEKSDNIEASPNKNHSSKKITHKTYDPKEMEAVVKNLHATRRNCLLEADYFQPKQDFVLNFIKH